MISTANIEIGASFEVLVPINLLDNICPVSVELDDGLAFRLRAVGETGDGAPIRSSHYFFFPHGSYSLLSREIIKTLELLEVKGFKSTFTKRVSSKGKIFWEIKFAEGEHGVVYSGDYPKDLYRLHFSDGPPDDDEYEFAIMLVSADGPMCQNVYLH